MKSPRIRRRPSSLIGLLPPLFCSILFAVLSALLYDYHWGLSTNHAFYLPAVLQALDPSLFPNDPAVAAAASMPGWFWPAVTALARIVGLEHALFGLWIFSRCIGGAAAWGAARALGGGKAAAALATAFVFFSVDLFLGGRLAGDPLFKPFLDQTSFAWPFALAALALWLSRRHLAAFACLGLLANLNPLVSVLTALWLTLGGLIEESEDLPGTIKNSALFLLCASPVLWALAQAGAPDYATLLAATPNTYLASAWPWERWVIAGCWLALWAVVFGAHPSSRNLSALLLSALGLWAASAFAGRIGMNFILGLQLFRLDAPLSWLAAVSAGVLIAHWGKEQRPKVFVPALGAGWAFAVLEAPPALALWSAGMILLEGTGKRLAFWTMGGAVFALASLFAVSRPPFFLEPTTALLTLFVSVSAGLGATAKAKPWRRSRHRMTLAAFAVLAIFPVAGILRERLNLGAGDAPKLTPAEQWAAATPPGTKFIVPPWAFGFRLRTGRPAFAEWSDFNLALFDREASAAWRGRMASLGVDWERFGSVRLEGLRTWDRSMLRRGHDDGDSGMPTWGPQDSQRLMEAGREYGARYLLAPARAKLNFPVAYDGQGWLVHDLAPQI